jgi:hypothetical protein
MAQHGVSHRVQADANDREHRSRARAGHLHLSQPPAAPQRAHVEFEWLAEQNDVGAESQHLLTNAPRADFPAHKFWPPKSPKGWAFSYLSDEELNHKHLYIQGCGKVKTHTVLIKAVKAPANFKANCERTNRLTRQTTTLFARGD